MNIPEIDQPAFAAALADGAPVLDVRDPEEYVDGHIPGARLVPLPQVEAHLPWLRSHRPVLVVCESGARSRRAAEILSRAGQASVVLRGGTAQWRAAQRPVVRGAHAA